MDEYRKDTYRVEGRRHLPLVSIPIGSLYTLRQTVPASIDSIQFSSNIGLAGTWLQSRPEPPSFVEFTIIIRVVLFTPL